MKEIDPKSFHNLYGPKKPRIAYQRKDFLDYVLMSLITAVVLWLSYGSHHPMAWAGIALCAIMPIVFVIRHGLKLRAPLLLRRPQELVFSLIYQVQNLRPTYFAAVGLLLLENYLIHVTPQWPHHVELMHTIALYLFYIHFASITLYRTAILVAHLRKQQLIREVLSESSFKTYAARRDHVGLEIVHAYLTGTLTHLAVLAPWYLVITHASFSVLFLPVVCFINVVIQIKVARELNAWLYRDHWLGHNSELEFLYFHGTHHDAIPCALIGVSENGHLEGFMRHALGLPNAFFNPVITFWRYMILTKANIDSHQYIPGVFPGTKRELQTILQHSVHHLGRLEPYGLALNLDQPGLPDKVQKVFERAPAEVKNAIKLEEALSGFEWNNPKYKQYLEVVDKYSK